MAKAKLFRRGKYVGLVNEHFYDEELRPNIWDKLEIDHLPPPR